MVLTMRSDISRRLGFQAASEQNDGDDAVAPVAGKVDPTAKPSVALEAFFAAATECVGILLSLGLVPSIAWYGIDRLDFKAVRVVEGRSRKNCTMRN
jgi:hypothetical protein